MSNMTYQEIKAELSARPVSQLPALLAHLANLCRGSVFAGEDNMHRFLEKMRDVDMTEFDSARRDAGAFDFGHAIQVLRAGGYVTRVEWIGKGRLIGLQVPDAHSKMGLPYIYIRTAQGQLVPWLPGQTDLLATDWIMAGDLK